MPALILIHGVGNPTDEELKKAAENIALAFDVDVGENRHFINWNRAVAEQTFAPGEFRWTGAWRTFRAVSKGAAVCWVNSRARRWQALHDWFFLASQFAFAIAMASLASTPLVGMLLSANHLFSSIEAQAC
jgi:hypothetical protein